MSDAKLGDRYSGTKLITSLGIAIDGPQLVFINALINGFLVFPPYGGKWLGQSLIADLCRVKIDSGD